MRLLMASMLKDMLTGLDGESYDVGRAEGALAVLVYLGLGIAGLCKATPDHPFDFQGFGIGFGSLVAGVGVLIRLKQGTEPKGPQP